MKWMLALVVPILALVVIGYWVHVLWWVAIAALIVFLVSFFLRR